MDSISEGVEECKGTGYVCWCEGEVEDLFVCLIQSREVWFSQSSSMCAQ